jgi:hypothetical protein
MLLGYSMMHHFLPSFLGGRATNLGGRTVGMVRHGMARKWFLCTAFRVGITQQTHTTAAPSMGLGVRADQGVMVGASENGSA